MKPRKGEYSTRLNGKRIVETMNKKALAKEAVCSRTGLSTTALLGILEDGFASEDAAERIADAVGLTVGEILLPEITGNVENVIEFIKDSERATVTFCQGRYKSRIKKLAAERPEECEIVAENQDGSLCAHVPTTWIRISPPAARTETQRQLSREKMLAYHSERVSTAHENR